MTGTAPVRRPRGPGVVLSVGATLVLLLVGVVALDAAQSPPPTVAEFAPAALDQITDPPDEQATDIGDPGPGASAGPSATPRPRGASGAPSPGVSQPPVERVRACTGGRQIEDPQSPPCVIGWKGDNGGATSFGVTRDEIRVAAPYGTAFTGDPTDQWQAMVKFFNARFEFYGRKLVLQPLYTSGDNFAYPDPKQMLKDASKVASELKSFATLGYTDRKGGESHYYDALADRRIISIIGRETAVATEAHLAKRAPYQWMRGMAIDGQLASYGQFVCNEWAGRELRYGGPWPFAQQPNGKRKFGVLVTEATDGSTPDIRPLRDNLAPCGLDPFVYTTTEAQSDTDATNPIAAMVREQVTTVICVCDVGSARLYLSGASRNGYHPEWLMGSYINNDVDNAFSQSTNDQTDNVFGISFLDKYLPVQDAWWYRAMREGDPSVPYLPAAIPMSTYQSLLLLASGIQAAGPNLTPQTFSDALQRTVFANPGAGRAPYYQGRVGFVGASHSWHRDASTYWYDVNSTNVSDPTARGRVCHVRHGTRYEYGGWPKEDPPYKETSCT